MGDRLGYLVYVTVSLKREPVGLVQLDGQTWSIQFGPLLNGILNDAEG